MTGSGSLDLCLLAPGVRHVPGEGCAACAVHLPRGEGSAWSNRTGAGHDVRWPDLLLDSCCTLHCESLGSQGEQGRLELEESVTWLSHTS